MDWQGYNDVKVIPGKVSGAPLLRDTRLPVAAITENYDAFLEEGSTRSRQSLRLTSAILRFLSNASRQFLLFETHMSASFSREGVVR